MAERLRNERLEAEIKGLRELVAELRQARDGWQETATAALKRPLMLTAPEPAACEPRRAWWTVWRRAG
jgi:hypothetical protein